MTKPEAVRTIVLHAYEHLNTIQAEVDTCTNVHKPIEYRAATVLCSSLLSPLFRRDIDCSGQLMQSIPRAHSKCRCPCMGHGPWAVGMGRSRADFALAQDYSASRLPALSLFLLHSLTLSLMLRSAAAKPTGKWMFTNSEHGIPVARPLSPDKPRIPSQVTFSGIIPSFCVHCMCIS